MQDDEIALYNGCTDLIGLRKHEGFPRRLLERGPGEWVRVREFYSQAGELKPELFAAWLPDPAADEAYAVILFYDDESKWSMAAHYNRGRLLKDAPPTSPLPIGAASPASAGSTPQPAARTAEA